MALSGGWRVELAADLEDDVFLNTAVDGRATLLVSGDKTDLLTLRTIESVPIVSAREALLQAGVLARRDCRY
jgi:predicted nucleic acid-binding protein